MKLPLLIVVTLGAVLIVGFFFFLKPQPSSQTSSPMTTSQETSKTQQEENSAKKTYQIAIENKQIVSGENVLQATEGDELTFVITSDEADEFHVHGYDQSIDLEVGKPVELRFIADTSGRFPFELETSQTELGVLEVQPK